MAQDEATSVVYGMPKVALEEGSAEISVPLPHIAGRIVDLVGTQAGPARRGRRVTASHPRPGGHGRRHENHAGI